MVFNKLFEKIFKKEKDSKTSKKEISFEETETWIISEKEKTKNTEKEILNTIENKKKQFLEEIKENIKNIEELDVDSKDADKRIKKIVKKNVNEYLVRVKKLTENINKLDENSFEAFINTINNNFIDFEKKSILNYEKAIFLIDKPLVDLRKTIADFSNFLIKVFEKNKDIISVSRKLSFVQEKVQEIKVFNKKLLETNENIKQIDEKIKNLEQENKNILENIKNIKEDKEYIENLEKIEDIKKEETKLKKELLNLKEMIDFKALGNIFHIDENKIKVIKNYKDDFEKHYLNDNGDNILKLLDDAKLNSSEIIFKANHINNIQKEIIRKKATINKDKTKDLLVDIDKNKKEIENLSLEKMNEHKKYEKTEIAKEELIVYLKKTLDYFNIKLDI